MAGGTAEERRSDCAAMGNPLGIYSHSNQLQNLAQPALRETSLRDHRGMDGTARRCCLAARAAACRNSPAAHPRIWRDRIAGHGRYPGGSRTREWSVPRVDRSGLPKVSGAAMDQPTKPIPKSLKELVNHACTPKELKSLTTKLAPFRH